MPPVRETRLVPRIPKQQKKNDKRLLILTNYYKTHNS